MADPKNQPFRKQKNPKVTQVPKDALNTTKQSAKAPARRVTAKSRGVTQALRLTRKAPQVSENVEEAMRRRRAQRECDDANDVCISVYRTSERTGMVYYAENYTYYDIDLTVKLDVFKELVDKSIPDSTREIITPTNGSDPQRIKLLKLSEKLKKPPIPDFEYYTGNPHASHTKPGYTLPFPHGKEFNCSQGFNNASGTHGGMHAVDFVMPRGTTVTAARGGTVVFIGRSRKNSWLVRIRHDDGTYGEYGHLKPVYSIYFRRIFLLLST